MEITWSPTPNFSSRMGRSIIAIVNHITAGNFPGCLSWMKNPAAQASAQYLVTRAGEIYQLVADENAAWHAGIVNKPNWSLYDGTNPNRYTIGIEHENLGGGQLTEAQYQATLWLHKQLIAKYKIPVDADHIIGHYRIDSVNRPNCPGPNFPWERLFADLTQPAVSIKIGEQFFQGIIVENRSYAPVKAVMIALRLQYGWDANTNSVVVGANKIPVVIQNGNGYAKINELAAAIGRKVAWDANTRTATII